MHEAKKFHNVLVFLNTLWELGTDGGIELTYRPARLHSLAEMIHWNGSMGSL
jgi:hypothetical protein